jgi:hypothetical protein
MYGKRLGPSFLLVAVLGVGLPGAAQQPVRSPALPPITPALARG